MSSAAPLEALTSPPRSAESETLELLLPEVRRFAHTLDPAAIEAGGTIPEKVRRAAADLGLFGITIPEASGGAGLTLAGACPVVDTIARVDRSVAIMIGLHAGLGTRGLVEYGHASRQAEWLPKLASGEWIASFCATEASAGSDLTAIRTTAEATPHGFKLTGEKAYVTNGGFASVFTVLARTPGIGGARAQSVFCIPATTPGIQIGAEEDKLGICASSTVTVGFEGVEIPRENLIGEPGHGAEIAHSLLAWGRTLMSAGCVGTARAALDASVDHALNRRQFARAVGKFGSVREHLAWMAARVFAMESLVAQASEAHARGEPADQISAEAKVFCSDSSFLVCDRAVQLHGALGFLEPTGVARMLRDCRITRIFEGANDVLLVRLGTARIAADARAKGDAPASIAGAIFPGAAALREASEAVDALDAKVRETTSALRARGIEVMQRQLALRRLALAGTFGRAARACLQRATAGGTDRTAVAVLAVEELVREATRCLEDVRRSDRDEREVTAISEALYAATGRVLS